MAITNDQVAKILGVRRRMLNLQPEPHLSAKTLREALKSDPRTKQELSNHLASHGWFISPRELQRIQDEPEALFPEFSLED
jgi:hypothetical protein